MAVPASVVNISKKTQDCIITFLNTCYGITNETYNVRDKLRAADLLYMREVDRTLEQHKAALANRKGDPTKFQNITVPIVLPQVEAAVTYQASVFLQGYPMFGVVSAPGVEDAALMMDTAIGQQQDRGNWTQEFIKTFRDGFKYNIMAVEVDWCKDVTFAIGTEDTSRDAKLTEVTWAGNKVKWMDMYNTFFDSRVKPYQIASEGEFAGYSEMYSRIRMKKFVKSLGKIQNEKLMWSTGAPAYGSYGTESYYMPTLNPTALISPTLLNAFSWENWLGVKRTNTNTASGGSGGYLVTTFYARICPEDYHITGVPGPDVPQVWKFIIVNNRVVIYAERMTNAHGLIPIIFGQPLDDGLGYQTKSFSDNVAPFQAITTALANSLIAAQRRAISDRMLYDPSRISASAINSDSPTSKIPIKPAAFGQDLKSAVLPIPFQNDQFQYNISGIQQFSQMANQVSGLNAAKQGQFIKGNKTRGEFDTIMQNANGRDETVAISIENSFMSQIKEVIKANILQYQGSETVYNREQQQSVEVDPVALRQAMLIFKISDGKTPSAKLIDADALMVAFQTMQSVPQIAQGYNIVPMFSYLMKSAGAKINAFEKPQQQIAFEQAGQQWMMAVGQVAQAISQAKDITPEQIQELMKQLPPQPTPQQYGFDPEQKYNSEYSGKSIMQVVSEATQGAASRVPAQASGSEAASAQENIQQ